MNGQAENRSRLPEARPSVDLQIPSTIGEVSSSGTVQTHVEDATKRRGFGPLNESTGLAMERFVIVIGKEPGDQLAPTGNANLLEHCLYVSTNGVK